MIPFEEKVARPTYVYFGYMLQNEDEVLAFLESYPAFIEDQVSFNDDLPAPMGRGSLGGDVFLRLSAKSLDEKDVLRGTLPLMFELPDYTDNSFLFRHGENAGYVKYPGAGIELVEFGAAFPMTPEIIGRIVELKRRYSN